MKSFCLLLFILQCTAGKAEDQVYRSMRDIPILVNLDSMERLVPVLANQPYAKLRHLITIEYSRIVFNSYKSGQYIPLIDSLSRVLKSKFGLGFVFYYKSLEIEHQSFHIHNFRYIERYGDSSISTFNELKDDFGLFTTKVNLYRNLTLKKRPLNLQEKTIHLHFQKNDSLFLIQSKQLEQEINGIVYRHRNDMLYRLIWNYNLARDIYKRGSVIDSLTNMNKSNYIRKKIKKNIDLINQNPQFFYLGFENYNLYANSYYLVRNFNKCVEHHLLCLNQYVHKESLNNQKLYTNLAGEYASSNKKHKYDSAFYYAKKVLDNSIESGFTNYNKAYVWNTMHRCYAELGKIDSAYKYITLQNEITEIFLQETLLKNYASTIDFEKLREKETEAKFNFQLIIFGSILIFILLAVLIAFIFYSKKIKTAKEKIEILQVEREKFYSILSHDLRSPIESYNGLSRIISSLIKQQKYDDIYKIAEQIDKTSQKLKSLIENLIAWSIDQQNLRSILPQKIKLADSIESVVSLYSNIIQDKSIHLVKAVDVSFVLETDKYILETIIRNLVDNALKNSNKNGEVEIILSKNEQNPILSISNYSTLTDKKFQQLTEFFTQDNTWQIGREGIGLGLFIIRDFARKLGYGIRLDYQNDRFTIELAISPLQKA